jgi:hypothetical protein
MLGAIFRVAQLTVCETSLNQMPDDLYASTPKSEDEALRISCRETPFSARSPRLVWDTICPPAPLPFGGK